MVLVLEIGIRWASWPSSPSRPRGAGTTRTRARCRNVGSIILSSADHRPGTWPCGRSFLPNPGGVEAAVARAQEIAGDRTVAVTAGTVARQCLELGLLDEVAVDLVPVVMGAGRPVFRGAVARGRPARRPNGLYPGRPGHPSGVPREHPEQLTKQLAWTNCATRSHRADVAARWTPTASLTPAPSERTCVWLARGQGGPERAVMRSREVSLGLRCGWQQRLHLLGEVVEARPEGAAERGGESVLGKVRPVPLHDRR